MERRDEMKVLKFPTFLERDTLATWLELSEEEQANYNTASFFQVTRDGGFQVDHVDCAKRC